MLVNDQGKIDEKFWCVLFFSDISEFIIGLIYRFSLSEMCFAVPVLQSSDLGDMLEHVVDTFWPSFLSLETQHRGTA